MQFSPTFKFNLGSLFKRSEPSEPAKIYDKFVPDRVLADRLYNSVCPVCLSELERRGRLEKLFLLRQHESDYCELGALLSRCDRRVIFTSDLIRDEYQRMEYLSFPEHGLDVLCELGFLAKRQLTKQELLIYNFERGVQGLRFQTTATNIYWVKSYGN